MHHIVACCNKYTRCKFKPCQPLNAPCQLPAPSQSSLSYTSGEGAKGGYFIPGVPECRKGSVQVYIYTGTPRCKFVPWSIFSCCLERWEGQQMSLSLGGLVARTWLMMSQCTAVINPLQDSEVNQPAASRSCTFRRPEAEA